ncbi:PREDICTED: LOW QUALITY PROTEIN: spindle and centriole-associated protein 1, partial [Gekko japonicus]|uniref:Spindle and centriole-associated protein 1 n=1 Tax=Gekko japonicus TaxID=146911 RepID=A0ABM1LA87_GEKJA
ILSDQYHLQDVLERSDRAMAVVKDLFGDAPRRHAGFPNVTVAPDCDVESAQGPIAQKRDPPTQLSVLSESVMDPQALNEVRESSSGFLLEGENIQDVSFDSRSIIDANRVSRLPKEKGSVTNCHEKAIKQRAGAPSAQEANMLATPTADLPSPDCAALNATKVVKRVHSRLENEEQIADITYIVQQVLNANLKKQKQTPAKVKKTHTPLMPAGQKKNNSNSAPVSSGNVSSLDVLNQMMRDVEQEMDDYERWTGREVQPVPNGHGLSGFTYSLVNALCRVMSFLKESEARLRQEALKRQQLEGEMSEHRALIDALTAEILLMREENLTLQSKLQQYMFVTDEQLTSLTRALKGLPISESNRARSPGETSRLSIWSPEAIQGKPLLNYVGPKTDTFGGEKMPELSQVDLPSKGPVSLSPPDHAEVGQVLSSPPVHPAVLLSPPLQKNSQTSLPFQDDSSGRESDQEERSSVSSKPLTAWEDSALFPQRGRAPFAAGAPQNSLQTDSHPAQGAFSVAARPGLGGFAERLNLGPPTACARDDDLQGQIAQLTFQNSVIRAQLNQSRPSHPEMGDCSKQPGTAQNASGKEGQETSQATSSLKEPPKSLELQLINQQKLATLVSVSPPISPIPLPAVNLGESGRRKIEVSIPVAETLDSSKEDIPSPASGTSARR